MVWMHMQYTIYTKLQRIEVLYSLRYIARSLTSI